MPNDNALRRSYFGHGVISWRQCKYNTKDRVTIISHYTSEKTLKYSKLPLRVKKLLSTFNFAIYNSKARCTEALKSYFWRPPRIQNKEKSFDYITCWCDSSSRLLIATDDLFLSWFTCVLVMSSPSKLQLLPYISDKLTISAIICKKSYRFVFQLNLGHYVTQQISLPTLVYEVQSFSQSVYTVVDENCGVRTEVEHYLANSHSNISLIIYI